MKNNYFLLFLCLIIQSAFSQGKIIHGKIVADGNNVEGINVMNLVTEKTTITDANGEFKIAVKSEDLLIFSAINFEYKRKLIEEKDLESKTIIIEMVPKPGQLEEVVITKYNISAVDLGILKRPAKEYTPAERKLKTATDLNLSVGFGFSMSFDPLINAISGRTKMLKSEVLVERNELAIKKLQELYSNDYFNQKLKIPMDYIKGFQNYASSDAALVDALNKKNTQKTEFALTRLAQKYLQLLADEK